jgi:hypothetical protein
VGAKLVNQTHLQQFSEEAPRRPSRREAEKLGAAISYVTQPQTCSRIDSAGDRRDKGGRDREIFCSAGSRAIGRLNPGLTARGVEVGAHHRGVPPGMSLAVTGYG